MHLEEQTSHDRYSIAYRWLELPLSLQNHWEPAAEARSDFFLSEANNKITEIMLSDDINKSINIA
jgi:hypothetical protein